MWRTGILKWTKAINVYTECYVGNYNELFMNIVSEMIGKEQKCSDKKVQTQ